MSIRSKNTVNSFALLSDSGNKQTKAPIAKKQVKSTTRISPQRNTASNSVSVRRNAPTVSPQRNNVPSSPTTSPTSLKLPLIYKTDIPEKLESALRKGEKVIIVSAPTGYGKTVMINQVMAKISKEEGTICSALMPFRVSVLEMHKFLNKLYPEYKFGYAMRGNIELSPNDNSSLMTVGYWLEKFLRSQQEHGERFSSSKVKQIVMLDEAHDATWQTDLSLRLLLWCIKQGAPIQLIISSATLDIESIVATNPLKLCVETEKPNVIVHYQEDLFLTPQMRDFSLHLTNRIKDKLDTVVKEHQEGDILVIVPGREEIDKTIQNMERDKKFDDFLLYPLYSGLTKEEINEAILPSSKGRKIIVATSIVENAITIDRLAVVIDSSFRKVASISSDGIQSLVMSYAAQSNMKQALGRVGRQGITGHAYLLLSEYDFQSRPQYSENEVQKNPLYLQIVKLIGNNLPVVDIMQGISEARINNDIEYLITNQVLKREGEKVKVTDIGRIVTGLPCSIRAGRFVAETVRDVDSTYWYSAISLAAWIDIGTSVFLSTRKRPRESDEDYEDRNDKLSDLQRELYEDDCISTFLSIWYKSWVDSKKRGFLSWCQANGLADRTLKDIDASVKSIISALDMMSYKVTVPSFEACRDIDLKTHMDFLKPVLVKVYFDRTYVASAGWRYRQVGVYSSMEYSIDMFIKSPVKNTQPRLLLALSLRKVKHNLTAMSNILTLHEDKEEEKSLFDKLSSSSDSDSLSLDNLSLD